MPLILPPQLHDILSSGQFVSSLHVRMSLDQCIRITDQAQVPPERMPGLECPALTSNFESILNLCYLELANRYLARRRFDLETLRVPSKLAAKIQTWIQLAG